MYDSLGPEHDLLHKIRRQTTDPDKQADMRNRILNKGGMNQRPLSEMTQGELRDELARTHEMANKHIHNHVGDLHMKQDPAAIKREADIGDNRSVYAGHIKDVHEAMRKARY